jgi:putative phosphoesterase
MGFCMRIGVISDTHGSVTAWRKAYDQLLKSADLIVHAGDLLYHGPRNPLPEGYDPASLARELSASAVPLVIAGGNCDSDIDQMVVNRPLQTPYACCWLEGLRILVHHGHMISPEELPPYISKDTCDVFISGHTHVAGISRNSGVLCLNPGSPSLSKTGGGIPTIGWIEGGSVRIIRLDTGATTEQQQIGE